MLVTHCMTLLILGVQESVFFFNEIKMLVVVAEVHIAVMIMSIKLPNLK